MKNLFRRRLISPLLVGAIVVLYLVERLWSAGNIDKVPLILIAIAGALFPVVIALLAVRAASKSTARDNA